MVDTLLPAAPLAERDNALLFHAGVVLTHDTLTCTVVGFPVTLQDVLPNMRDHTSWLPRYLFLDATGTAEPIRLTRWAMAGDEKRVVAVYQASINPATRLRDISLREPIWGEAPARHT
jgi:hypothetical protein